MGLKDLIGVRQRFDDSCITDVENVLLSELEKLDIGIGPGSRIAITAGSRGISDIVPVLRTTAAFIRAKGGEPFLVPAMGSHGGATAEGQVKVLQSLGITEKAIGVPILATMDAVELNRLDVSGYMPGRSGFLPVYMDRNAYEADGVIAVNRIKPHTSFHSEVESGLMKMLVVGLGKQVQASSLHGYGTQGLRSLIAPAAGKVLAGGRVKAGIAIVENAYEKTLAIRAFGPEEMEKGEKELLALARRNMPCLPVERIDVLIVDEIGKNFSGTGLDTNIIGRIKIEGESEPGIPDIKRIAVLGISRDSEGNAYGIGLADVTTRAVADSMDYAATYANALTSTFLERARLPLIAEDAEAALELALRTCYLNDPGKARIIRIKNTLQLEELRVSENICEEIKDRVIRL